MLCGEILLKAIKNGDPHTKKRTCTEGAKYMEIRRLCERQEEDRYQISIHPDVTHSIAFICLATVRTCTKFPSIICNFSIFCNL